MQTKGTGNMDQIKSTIAAGLKGHRREANLGKFYEIAQSLVKSFEQSTKLSIEDDRVSVNKIGLEISSKLGPDGNVGIAYNRRHKGWFPFEHDHCKVEICWETEVNGEIVEVCIEVEYPCNVDWPFIGRLDD